MLKIRMNIPSAAPWRLPIKIDINKRHITDFECGVFLFSKKKGLVTSRIGQSQKLGQ